MTFVLSRRGFVALAGMCLVSGCQTLPNAVTTENAPHDLGTSGKAYVVYDIHERLGGLLGDMRGYNGGAFINVAAPSDMLYLHAPDSMKLYGGPKRANTISAVDPGTYRLYSVGLGNNPCFFGTVDSPAEFTVAAGEVVYLGSLQYGSFRAYNPLNPFKTPRFHVTFEVHDELEAHRAALDASLALLPGHPALQTRLMTIRKAEVLVSSTKKNWLDSTPPKDDWAPSTPPAASQPSTPAPPAPMAVPPDNSGAWHETPSP